MTKKKKILIGAASVIAVLAAAVLAFVLIFDVAEWQRLDPERLHALAQRIAHARLHRRTFPFAEHAHQRASPFPCREIRGSTSTISRSPRIRPTIPMQL